MFIIIFFFFKRRKNRRRRWDKEEEKEKPLISAIKAISASKLLVKGQSQSECLQKSFFSWFFLPRFFCVEKISALLDILFFKTKTQGIGFGFLFLLASFLSFFVHCLIAMKLTLWNRYGQQPTRLNMICFLTFVIYFFGFTVVYTKVALSAP